MAENRPREIKEINIEFGRRLQEARKRAGLTQERLAEILGLNQQFLSKLERGVAGPSLTTIRTICKSLNISSDSLIFGPVQTNDLNFLYAQLTRLDPAYLPTVKIILEEYITSISRCEAQVTQYLSAAAKN